mmetsp:Transcript_10247/g.21575  ORF Transcript_10247/g.21575 Transcript_10247/m.21575 type:complete len:279 (-) Transcript_10247:292-1128(-)|eukprot:CAMPEP_0183317800 /NCGR_PEP_ID=MMETSP0160_2-20130417/58935_1 /TAXON_ID=2839 ORGANISM="Odontella Sinensis, Strain Grunow 1884" /NCGR_SAMPLE_ID=MMETSP0160_2 /ASSEMBLY_ACC=CAM_ASM_000250 /LENGTH=278 /DNA_ID=CAMNT_0025483903 /DNA_START=103 /DNA_END=939 /DNA_ORIENTATION=-
MRGKTARSPSFVTVALVLFLFAEDLSAFESSSRYATFRRRVEPRADAHLTRARGWLDGFLPKTDPQADADRRRDFPEQYPASYELSDAVVSSDDSDASMIRPLLKQTQLESRPLALAYDASRDGWNPSAFHSGVDGSGAAIVLATTKEGRIIGGYNPKGWSSLGGARPSVAAFLFYSTGDGGFQKLRKVGGGGLACANDDPNYGISFGPDALVIGLQSGREKYAQSKLGPYFERGPNELPSLFDGGLSELLNLKVFVGVYEPEEEIPYSGAVLDMTSG